MLLLFAIVVGISLFLFFQLRNTTPEGCVVSMVVVAAFLAIWFVMWVSHGIHAPAYPVI